MVLREFTEKLAELIFSYFAYFFSLCLRLDSIKPIQYLENKAVLNKALERLNWPISLKELLVLENEILVGKMYIQQAMELQEAARKNRVNKTLEEVGPTASSVPRTLPLAVLAMAISTWAFSLSHEHILIPKREKGNAI